MKHMLETYAIDSNVTKINSNFAPFVKLPNISSLESVNELCLTTLRGPHIYDEYVPKRIIARRLLKGIWHNSLLYSRSYITYLQKKLTYPHT